MYILYTPLNDVRMIAEKPHNRVKINNTRYHSNRVIIPPAVPLRMSQTPAGIAT